MRQSARVIVFNADEDYSATIRSDLLSLDGVQIVAELDELGLLDQALGQFPVDLLLVHLDPLPERVLPAVIDIARARPELAILVVSDTTDGQLILRAVRAGIREFISKPIDRAQLSEAVEKIREQNQATVEVGTLVSVLSTAGGTGASTLAVNLAAELNDLPTRKRPVALVDLDFRYGQLATMLDLQADYTITDLCDTPEQLDPAMIDKAMVKHGSGLHLLARPNQFAQADQITAAHYASVLSSLQQVYEYVIVDGPNRYDSGGLAVLDLADVTLLVVQLLVPSVRNAHRMLNELRDNGYNLSRFRLVCNRAGRDSGHLNVEHIEKTLNMKVSHQIPDDWKTVSTAINVGVSLLEHAPKSRVRLAIRELAERIAHPQEEVPDSPARQGLLGRIFSGVS
ncbi:MAG: AAA family ATPase [Phycisphaerae bacterium]|jgi:pilus assembly protein CpaE